ncbi:MAG: Maf family protein [Lachnospiraceae bacterium]|nr:Maf family protein [Lachnospiraceae bacterium]
MRTIILASQSPRRRELLEQAGYIFKIIPSTVEETVTCNEPSEVVKELAMQKARDVFEKCSRDASDDGYTSAQLLVIGADTVVAADGNILGKPESVKHAKEMIHCLQGKTHYVHTGVAFVWADERTGLLRTHCFSESTAVSCYPMTEEEITAYVNTGECMDKAGAYGIQGRFGIFIRNITGDYNNVVGLPISAVYHQLIKCGLQ